jgi:hypothetical protein
MGLFVTTLNAFCNTAVTITHYTIGVMKMAPHPFAGPDSLDRTRSYSSTAMDRREMIGLLASLVIFLAGMPGNSETLSQSTTIVFRHLIRLVLVFLGLISPVGHSGHALWHIHTAPKAVTFKPVRAHPAKPIPDSMMFGTDPHLHRFNYIFEGIATFHNQPCAHASVLVRLISGEQTAAKGTVTEADGSYHIEVPIDAADQSPVDWTMNAYTADFDKVELSGRRIVQNEEEATSEPITVTTPVEFVVSLSK